MQAVISYNGACFYGSSRQKHTKQTVQEALELALQKLHINSKTTFSGRTDTGVHALNQSLSFKAPSFWSDTNKLQFFLNKLLKDIYIKKINIKKNDFHARFCAKTRTYRYVFYTKEQTPFLSPFVAFKKNLEKEKINEILSLFLGAHDFNMFKKTGSNEKSTKKTIFKSFCYKYNDFFVIVIEADGFLRSMVRLIVSAVLAVFDSKISMQDLQDQIDNKKRLITKPFIPNGLYLSRVKY